MARSWWQLILTEDTEHTTGTYAEGLRNGVEQKTFFYFDSKEQIAYDRNHEVHASKQHVKIKQGAFHCNVV